MRISDWSSDVCSSDLHPDIGRAGEPIPLSPADLTNRVWVTRRGVHVDRIACGWLIRRFIDPEVSFKFVGGKGYMPESGELRFDMAAAAFTHEEDRCSFETLVDRKSTRLNSSH